MSKPGFHEDDPVDKSYDRTLLRRLLRYLRPYWAPVLASFLLIVGMAALDLVGPYLTKIAIDRYIRQGNATGLDRIALLYLGALFLAFVVRFGQVYLLQMTGQKVMMDLRREIYAHLQRLHVAFFDQNPVGRLMTRVTTDVDAVNELFTSGVVTVFGDLFTLFGIMGVMMAMNWKLALVTFSVIPVLFLVTNWFRQGSRASFRAVRKWVARINAFLQENLTGMSVVQLFRREDRNLHLFADINRQHADANVRSIFYYAIFYPAIDVLAAVAAGLILLYGGSRVLSGTLTLGVLVAFVQYSERFWRPISDLSDKFNILQAAMASSERIFTLLDTPAAVVAPSAPVRLPRVRGSVAFENVSFGYVPGQPVLRNVGFAVEPGRRVALVGATGAGKTSVISLLSRFYDVQEGRITIGGVDIRDLHLHELRAMFGLVLQDVHLFSGTIAGNVRLGNESIGDAAVRRAVDAVHAGPFIDRLPAGLETPVAERGATLSVGQKQLLSFARALAFDPPVLVLDEATSSVDTETELLIRDALTVVMRGRTTIAIAHRLSTIQDMDRILVLHKGELRESGTHQELLAHRGIYHRLYQLQFKDSELVNSR